VLAEHLLPADLEAKTSIYLFIRRFSPHLVEIADASRLEAAGFS